MSCSQLIEVEDLVLGTAEPARAQELRGHMEDCTACRLEQVALSKERALFTHRARALSGGRSAEMHAEMHTFAEPPASIAGLLRAQLTAEVADPGASPARLSLRGRRVGPARRGASLVVRRGASALGQVLRRGHVSAACAAFLFALVAFSKLGGAPILPQPAADGAGEEPADGRIASFSAASRSDETLACSLGVSMMTTRDDQLVSSGATTQSSSHGSTIRDELACGRGSEGSRASCEPSVTCSALRQ